MKDVREHWAWDVPQEKMRPLGDDKYNALWAFISSERFMVSERQLNVWDIVEFIEADRRNASRIYIIYKYDIENNSLHIKAKEAAKAVTKKAKKKVAKKAPALPANVIDFSNYKRKVV